jgi:hypothetical protein
VMPVTLEALAFAGRRGNVSWRKRVDCVTQR